MCMMVIGVRMHRNFPIYVGFNREEEIKRKTTPPKLIEEGRAVCAGIDEREGGTWLGVNQDNLLVALGNRSEKGGRPGKKRSRGLFVLDLIRLAHPDKVQSYLKKNARFYKPFNLFYGNLSVAYVSTWNGKRLSTERLETGHHVITSGNVDDRKNPRVKRALELLEKKPESAIPGEILTNDWRDLFFQLIQICRDHEPEKELTETLCRHDKPVKTVSSTLLALANRGAGYSFLWHEVGNPCQGTYRDYSNLLRKITVPIRPAAQPASVKP